MAEQVTDARPRAATGCAFSEAKRYSCARLPATQSPGEGRPGGYLLAKIEARRAKDGPQ